MKTEQVLLTTTLRLTANVIARRFIGYNGAQAGAGEAALGVSAYDANAGEPAGINTHGFVLVEAGAAIAAGDAVAADAQGCAVKQESSAVTLGRAVDAAAQQGDIIRIKMGG